MQSDEARKADARARWHRYRATPEGAAKIKAREAARARDKDLCRRKHRRRVDLHRDRLQACRRTADRRARALKQGVPFALPTSAEPAVPATCCLCDAPFVPAVRQLQPDLDRVVPAAGYVPGNVQWLHRTCNSRKGVLTLAGAEALPDSPWRAQLLDYLRRCSPSLG